MKEGLLQVHLSPHSRVSRVAPRWPSPPLRTHLQFLLGPVGSRCVPQLSRGGGDLPDDAPALGRASRHKRSQELTELACIRIKEAVTLNAVILLLRKHTPVKVYSRVHSQRKGQQV